MGCCCGSARFQPVIKLEAPQLSEAVLEALPIYGDLNADLWGDIYDKLDTKDILNLSSVNRFARNLLDYPKKQVVYYSDQRYCISRALCFVLHLLLLGLCIFFIYEGGREVLLPYNMTAEDIGDSIECEERNSTVYFTLEGSFLKSFFLVRTRDTRFIFCSCQIKAEERSHWTFCSFPLEDKVVFPWKITQHSMHDYFSYYYNNQNDIPSEQVYYCNVDFGQTKPNLTLVAILGLFYLSPALLVILVSYICLPDLRLTYYNNLSVTGCYGCRYKKNARIDSLEQGYCWLFCWKCWFVKIKQQRTDYV